MEWLQIISGSRAICDPEVAEVEVINLMPASHPASLFTEYPALRPSALILREQSGAGSTSDWKTSEPTGCLWRRKSPVEHVSVGSGFLYSFL